MAKELTKKDREITLKANKYSTENTNFKKQIMIDMNNINNEIKKNKLIKKIDEEPELLDTLSNKQLERIYKMYLDEIEKKQKVLDSLKNSKK